MKRHKMIIGIIAAILVVCVVGIAGWLIANRATPVEGALTPIESDSGNVSDDNWTARY